MHWEGSFATTKREPGDRPGSHREESTSAVRLDPLSARANTSEAYALLRLERFPEAIAQAQKGPARLGKAALRSFQPRLTKKPSSNCRTKGPARQTAPQECSTAGSPLPRRPSCCSSLKSGTQPEYRPERLAERTRRNFQPTPTEANSLLFPLKHQDIFRVALAHQTDGHR